MKNCKKEQGITLIALIITIIVMLILVTVTITMAINGKLFEYAGQAAKKTNNAITEETELTNIPANMTTDELIDQFTATGEVTYGYNSQTNTFIGRPDSRRTQTNTTFAAGHFARMSGYNEYQQFAGVITPDSVYLCWDNPEVALSGGFSDADIYENVATWDVYDASGNLVGTDSASNHPN